MCQLVTAAKPICQVLGQHAKHNLWRYSGDAGWSGHMWQLPVWSAAVLPIGAVHTAADHRPQECQLMHPSNTAQPFTLQDCVIMLDHCKA